MISSIELTAHQLTELKQSQATSANDAAWQMARLYVASYKAMADELKARGESSTPQKINRAIRMVQGYQGPGGRWLSHAKRVDYEFCVVNNTKFSLPYDHYREIANSAVSDKTAVREWAEANKVTQKQLREHIRELVDADPERPDFPLRVSNHWKFSGKTSPEEFDGGIHPGIVANLLHYYTLPGDTVIDPMAGSGTTARVLTMYRYFQERIPGLPFSGPREILMSDIAPVSAHIAQADAVEGLLWDGETAALAIVDPPYWRVATGKYGVLGNTITEWRANIKAVIANCVRVVHPGGHIAVIADDYLRKDQYEPLAAYVMLAGLELGLTPAGMIYNTYPNFVVTMTPMMMKRAKEARLMVNETKIINVFQKDN